MNNLVINEKNKNDHLKKIEDLKDEIFVVKDYQRGYKWGKEEIIDLLEDINKFDINNLTKQSFYCLQPLVVTKDSHKKELIDGQQRLTTIFIILQCLGINLFTLEYSTRINSKIFLNNIVKNLKDIKIELSISDNITEFETLVNQRWEEYILNNSDFNNVDNYHFFTCYLISKYWLSQDIVDNKQFTKKLLKYTKVIWYEINPGNKKTPAEIFVDFNHGKIHLEQAELIKALFILKFKEEINSEIRAIKVNQFASEWNTIESKLQDEKFWFFVSNDTTDNQKYNRIDLLFDICNNKEKREKNKLFSYFSYLNLFNDNKLDCLEWDKVKNLFNYLEEWYDNRSYYHYIGLIIYMGVKNISEIYNIYQNIDNKNNFEENLQEILNSKIKFQDENSKYNLDVITYHNDKEVRYILVIFNVATYQVVDFNYKFPFNKLKTQAWSLEHIYAQNSKELQGDDRIQWFKDIKTLCENLDIKISENIKEIELEKIAEEKLNLHSIENLCLLDGATNSKLGNGSFLKKREKILHIDSLGLTDDKKIFIPICTKNIFMKYYTKSELKFDYWDRNDRDNYRKALEKTISNFLGLKNER